MCRMKVPMTKRSASKKKIFSILFFLSFVTFTGCGRGSQENTVDRIITYENDPIFCDDLIETHNKALFKALSCFIYTNLSDDDGNPIPKKMVCESLDEEIGSVQLNLLDRYIGEKKPKFSCKLPNSDNLTNESFSECWNHELEYFNTERKTLDCD